MTCAGFSFGFFSKTQALKFQNSSWFYEKLKLFFPENSTKFEKLNFLENRRFIKLELHDESNENHIKIYLSPLLNLAKVHSLKSPLSHLCTTIWTKPFVLVLKRQNSYVQSSIQTKPAMIKCITHKKLNFPTKTQGNFAKTQGFCSKTQRNFSKTQFFGKSEILLCRKTGQMKTLA